MEFLIKGLQLILALIVLVGIHELGHMLTAKMFGMRVEKFSIGFPPKIFGFTKGETEYSIGAIPLGGFVKISGMVDESMDVEKLKEEPQPWEFRSKPAWQRLIVMMGGIIFNIILGCVIFSGIVFFKGETYIPANEVKDGIVAYELAQKMGLKTGDKIVAVNGHEYHKFEELFSSDVLLGNNSTYTINRNGTEIVLPIPNNFVEILSDKESAGKFMDLRIPFAVDTIFPETGAKAGGLLAGDQIDSIEHQSTKYFYQLRAVLDSNKNKVVDVCINRQGTVVHLSVKVDEEGRVGFGPRFPFELVKEHFGVIGSVKEGSSLAFNLLVANVLGFRKMFSGDINPRKSIGGPLKIGSMFPSSLGQWESFWRITGLLSMALAFMNFLPIPALDGGHVMFLTFEMISGRKPSDKFLETAQKIGMVLLLSLMLFAFLNDFSDIEVVKKFFGSK